MRIHFLVRMERDIALRLKDWAERKREEDRFSLNTWLCHAIEDGMRKEDIL